MQVFKSSLGAVVILAYVIVGRAQGFDHFVQEWASHFDGSSNYVDDAVDLKVDANGNTYIVGNTFTLPDTVARLVVVKLDAAGQYLWSYVYTGPGLSDLATALTLDDSGNVIAGGVSLDPDTSAKALTVKIDSTGAEQWVRRDGDSVYEYEVTDIATDSAGNVFVTGYRDREPAMWHDSLLRKFEFVTRKISPTGTEEWVAIDSGTAGPIRIIVDPQGDAYIGGSRLGDTAGSADLHGDYSVVKYSGATGSRLWSASYDTPGSKDDEAIDMAIGIDGGLYVTGQTTDLSDDSPTALLTVKVNSSGSIAWAATYSDSGFLAAGGIDVSSDSGVYVGASSCYDCSGCSPIAIRYSYSGSQEWVRSLDANGGVGWIARALVDASQNPHFVGAFSDPLCTSLDFLALEYDPCGELLDSSYYDREGHWDHAIGVAFAENRNRIVGGTTFSTGSAFDASAVKYTRTGNFIRGDTDCDGDVDQDDVDTLAAFIFSAVPLDCMDAGDVNDNGTISAADLTALQNYLAGGAPPAAPFPDCGQDPTSDGLACEASCCVPEPIICACPISLTGDVNNSSTINSADIIYLVNYVFKGGAPPLPCIAAADVNCSGTINSADIIYLVNFVFKSGAAPCDACTSTAPC